MGNTSFFLLSDAFLFLVTTFASRNYLFKLIQYLRRQLWRNNFGIKNWMSYHENFRWFSGSRIHRLILFFNWSRSVIFSCYNFVTKGRWNSLQGVKQISLTNILLIVCEPWIWVQVMKSIYISLNTTKNW